MRPKEKEKYCQLRQTSHSRTNVLNLFPLDIISDCIQCVYLIAYCISAETLNYYYKRRINEHHSLQFIRHILFMRFLDKNVLSNLIHNGEIASEFAEGTSQVKARRDTELLLLASKVTAKRQIFFRQGSSIFRDNKVCTGS